MDTRTASYLEGRFKDYYRSTVLPVSERVDEREWGYIPFSTGRNTMIRHHSVEDMGDVSEFFADTGPRHMYRSASYYVDPGAGSMDDKEWKGSDVVFDIDVDEDHIPREVGDADSLTNKDMLAISKKHAHRLVEFLQVDFDIDPDRIVFSGGRGYHIHITRDDWTQLSSQHRTKLTGYITGTAVSKDDLFRESWNIFGTSAFDPDISFSPHSSWAHRVYAEFISRVTDLQAVSSESTRLAMLEQYDSVGPKRAQAINHIITTRYDELYAGCIPPQCTPIVDDCFDTVMTNTYAHIDEPVTTDVNRLLRMPNSLHGGHGLRVTTLSVTELESFEPLVDAVPDVFTTYDVRVDIPEPVLVELNENTYDLDSGTHTLPESVAIHLMCREQAVKIPE